MNDDIINLEEINLESLNVGDIIYGDILMKEKEGIWLDVGGKYNAFLDIEETTKEFRKRLGKNQIKGPIPLLIEYINYKEGVIRVSQKKAVEKQTWDNLILAYENDEIVEGRIKEFNEKGFIIELEEGVEGFIPNNLIDIYRPKNPNTYINKKVNARIIKLNPERKQIILSVRRVLEEKIEEKRQKLWEKIKDAEIVRGRVKDVSEEGLKVDLGFGILGFIPYNELSWFPIKNIYRNFQKGDIVKGKILKIDNERREVEISIRLAQPNPWEVFLEKNPIGSILDGEIVKITSGLVVKVNNLIGFVPPSEISWGRIGNIKEDFNVGEKVKVRVIEIDKEGKRILLSVKRVEPNPWDIIENIVQEGSIVKGKIINITDFGIFVEIKPGLEGLIPKRLLSWERTISLENNFKIGEYIEAKIINIDKDNKKLLLSRRELLPDPWKDISRKYKEGMNIKGRILEITPQGVIIEIEKGVEGFLPNSQKAKDDELELNQVLDLKILSINPSLRKMILSRKAFIREREELELEKYLEKHIPPKVTLGEIINFKGGKS